MNSFLRAVDDFLTEERARGFAFIVLISFIIIMGWVLYQTIIHWNQTYYFGFDFSSFWAAAKLATQGNADWAFNAEIFDALQDLAARADGVLYWHYPPTYVALIYPLGYLSPSAALLTFVGLIFVVWFVTVRVMIETDHWIGYMPVLLSPAFYMCVIGGQNGVFVTALLCLFVLGVVRKKDWMVVLACTLLLFKPHFGVLMPLVLLAIGRYRPIAITIVTGTLFIAWSIWMTGWDYVEAFIANPSTLTDVIGKVGLIDKQFSMFAFLSSLEAPQSLALGAHIIFVCFILALAWMAWRSPRVNEDIKIAVFLIGSIQISPYAFTYDAAASVIGMWYLHRATKHDKVPGQNLVIALVWIFPYVNRPIHEITGVSVAFLPMFALFVILWAHVRAQQIGPENTMFAKPA